MTKFKKKKNETNDYPKKKNIFFKIILIILSILIISFSVGISIYFTTYTFSEKPNKQQNNQQVSQPWIEKELYERQIFIKQTFDYQSFDELGTNPQVDNYFNAFIYDKNKILIPIDYIGPLDSTRNWDLEFPKNQYYYTTIEKADNKSINDPSIWTKINKFEYKFNFKDFNFSYDTKYNEWISSTDLTRPYLFCEVDAFDHFTKTKFSFESIMRNDSDYRYWYSSIYIDLHNQIKYHFSNDNCFSFKKIIPSLSELYIYIDFIDNNLSKVKFFRNGLKLSIFNIHEESLPAFSVDCINSVNAFIIDPVGSVFASLTNRTLDYSYVFYLMS